MAGSARSIANVTMISVRIAGEPEYIPAHIINGKDKPTSQRALFRVFHNTGGDKSNVFSCTAWGKLADAIARGAAPGKEISIIGELTSYSARVWREGPKGREPERNPDGTFKVTTKVGVKVDSIIFGSDSAKLVDDEIRRGVRPPMFNVNGSNDEGAWKQICAQRNAEQFTPGAQRFGYAIVKMPINAQLTTMPQTGTGYAQHQAPPQYNQAPPQYQAPAQGGYQAPPQYNQAPPAQQYNGYQAYSQPAQGGYQPPVAPQGYQPPVAPSQGGFQPPTTMANSTAYSSEMMY